MAQRSKLTKKEIWLLQRRIRNAARRIATPSGQIRLVNLRAELGDVPSETLDEVLLLMEQERSLILYSMDNSQEIRPEDRKGALPSKIGGRPRHIAYVMEGNKPITGNNKDKMGGKLFSRLRRTLLRGRKE